MATNILMPALSPTMTEGTLAKWLKKEGDTIRAGDVIAEIETDKATMEVEAVDEGTLSRILVAEGTANVAVNAPIAELVEDIEDAVPTKDKAAIKVIPPAITPKAPAPVVATPVVATPVVATPVVAAPVVAAPKANGHAPGERVFASPLARRIAGEAGIELSGIHGSGPNGRIVRADVEAVRGKPAAKPQAEDVVAPITAPPDMERAPAAKPAPVKITAPHTLVPMTSMRKIIARRLAEAKQTVPHFYVSMDIELDALLKLRADLNSRSPKDGAGAFKLSVNDLIIKAAATTLRRVPKVNASLVGDDVAYYSDVDISVAVSIPEGLITPIIRHADRKGLSAISNEMKDLAARAKTGKLKPEEFQGGGFSISNMGMFGVTSFAAIINLPQSAILAVAAGQLRAVVHDGVLAVATVMTCTLSVDHRVVDGALGAEWIAEFKRVVEDPMSLML